MVKNIAFSFVFTALLLSSACLHNRPFGNRVEVKQDDAYVIAKDPAKDAASYEFLRYRLFSLDLEGPQSLASLEKAARLDPDPYLLALLAKDYIQVNRFADAEKTIDLLLKKEGGQSIDALYLAGEIAEKTGRPQDAVAKYLEILEIDPLSQDAWLYLSRIFSQDEHPEKLMHQVQDILRRFPQNDQAHMLAGVVFKRMGDQKGAMREFKRALEINPTLLFALRNIAFFYDQDSDFSNALVYYQKILDLQPLDEQANGRMIQIYVDQKQRPKAIAALKNLERLEPQNIQVKLNLGKLYFENGQPEESLRVFRGVLNLNPDFYVIRFYEGIILEDLKRYDEAIATFQEIPPNSQIYVDSALHLSFLLQLKKDFDGSLRVLAQALRLRPEIPELYDLTASAYERKRQFDVAIDTLEKALKLHPRHERLNYYLGALYDRVGKRDSCIAQMKKVISINPDHSSALNYLGYTYADNQMNLAEAKSLVLRALKLRPNDAFIIDSLGWVNFRLGDLGEALVLLKKAVALAPDEGIILEHLGDVHHSLGNAAEAKRLYRKALSTMDQMAEADRDLADSKRLQEKIDSIVKIGSKPALPQ